MQVDHLHAITERIDEIAAKRRDQLDAVFFRQLVADFCKLLLVANDETEMTRAVRLALSRLEHREKLMLSDLEKRIAFTFIELGEVENVLIKLDGFVDIVDLDRYVIDAVNCNAHVRMYPALPSFGCEVAVGLGLTSKA